MLFEELLLLQFNGKFHSGFPANKSIKLCLRLKAFRSFFFFFKWEVLGVHEKEKEKKEEKEEEKFCGCRMSVWCKNWLVGSRVEQLQKLWKDQDEAWSRRASSSAPSREDIAWAQLSSSPLTALSRFRADVMTKQLWGHSYQRVTLYNTCSAWPDAASQVNIQDCTRMLSSGNKRVAVFMPLFREGTWLTRISGLCPQGCICINHPVSMLE